MNARPSDKLAIAVAQLNSTLTDTQIAAIVVAANQVDIDAGLRDEYNL